MPDAPSEESACAVPELTPRQAEIVDVATGVFAERGYAGGSMREIASRVGVTEPAIYRHFPGKDALFVAMVQVAGGRARKDAFALIDAITADNVREQLVLVMDDRRKAARAFAPVLRAVLNAGVNDPLILDEFRTVIVRPILGHMDAKAAQIDAEKHVPDADATRAARVRALFALMVGTMISSFALDDHPDEAAADAALRVMGWG